MGASKDFEYKIHLSVSADDFTPDIKNIFKNAQQEADKNAVKLTLTGDPKDIIKQLTDLKTKLPNFDLSNNVSVGLSDALKEDTEKGQKYVNSFLTNIINAVSEATNSISNITKQISNTEKQLKTSQKQLDFFGAGNAEKALENLTKKFQSIKADAKNIEELRNVFQQIKDITSSTGKELPKGVKDYQENLKKVFGTDIFKGINPVKTYEQYIEELSTEVFSLQNKLTDLKKQLESAQNPELTVKGKLADNFLDDLQSQLDKMTGIEVKVKPVVDKDVKLEIETEVKPKANTISKEDVIYHAGAISKLNKAETNGRFVGSNRGTGYYGTGHYFVDSNTKHELDKSGYYNKLPYTSVDISKYTNLYKANTDSEASKLHSFLQNLTRYTQGAENYNTDELFKQFEDVFGKSTLSFEEFNKRLESLTTFMEQSDLEDRSDSVSTQFMKSLGYEGVDTRGTKYADTRYGTVIYDLKEESILQANITDELEKQGDMLEKRNYAAGEVWDKDEDNRIQGILDEQKKQIEYREEYNKLYNSEDENEAYENLGKAEKRLEEIDSIIVDCTHSIENAEEEADQFFKDMEDLGLDVNPTEEEYQQFIEERKKSYQETIDELKEERAEVEASIPVLKEKAELESQKSGEAWKKAKENVDALHSETQAAEETKKAIEELDEVISAPLDTIPQDTEQSKLKEVSQEANEVTEKVKEMNNVLSSSVDMKSAEKTVKTFQKMKGLTEDIEDIENIIGAPEAYIQDKNINKAKTLLKTFDFSKLSNLGFDEEQIERIQNKALDIVKTFEQAKKRAKDIESGKINLEEWASIHGSEADTEIMWVLEDFKALIDELTPQMEAHIQKLKEQQEAAKNTALAEEELTEAEKKAVSVQNTSQGKETKLYEESSGQLSLFEEEAESKKKDAEATQELAEANKKLGDTPGQMTIDDYYKQVEKQAEATAESLEKMNQEANNITSPGLEVMEEDVEDIGSSAEVSTDRLEELRGTAESLGYGNVDVVETTTYVEDEDGKITPHTSYKMTDGQTVALLDEELNLQREIVTVLDDRTRAEAEVAEMERISASVAEESANADAIRAKQFKAFESEQKKYESSLDKKSVQKYKESYDELTKKVKEYIDLRKETAKSGKLDSEVPEIQQLDNAIIQMADDLEHNPLFNQAFEDKALSGLNNINAEVQSIRFDKIISNYKELSSLQAERDSLISKGVPEDSNYITYLDTQISKIEQENKSLQSLSYTKEQQKAIDEASVNVMQKVNKQQDLNAASGKKLEQTLESTRASLQKQAASLISNGQLMKVYGDQVNALYNEIKNPETTLERLKQIQIELNRISAEALAAGKSGKTLFQMLQQRAKSLVAYLSTFVSFYRAVSYIRTAITTIKDLDTQLVDLRKTTTMTTNELNSFYNASSDIAKQLGVTTSEIISQAAAWSRLGYSSQEAATKMAELSSKFTSISPGMTTDNATDYLVSTMQAYGIAVDEVERKVMDNVNKIGNTFATTNAEIGEMLTRSSAAMKAANNTLEETIALESAAVQITRNAETTGTAFRTISMRIRGYDEDTEELSSDLENISGDIYDLTKVGGKGISIFTDANRDTYKSTYEILKEISEVWDDLTDKQQADLLEKLGGKRGAQTIAGILADFSEVERAMTNMENAAGSADEEMGIIRDSLEFKINALKQTWVGMLQEVTDRGDIGNVIDALTKLSEGLGGVISKLGIIKTTLVSVFTIIGSKKLGIFDTQNGNTLFGAISNYSNQIKQNKQEVARYQNIASQYQGVLSLNALSTDPEAFLHMRFDTAKTLTDDVKANLIDIQNRIKDPDNTLTLEQGLSEIDDLMSDANNKIGEAQTRGTDLGKTFANIGKTLLNSVVSLGISLTISAAIQGIQNLINSYDDLIKKATEISQEFKSNKEQIDDYSSKISELRKTITDSTSSTQEITTATSELYEIQNDLISTYGAYHEGIDLVNGDLEEQLGLLQDINRENAQQAVNDINNERSAKSSGLNFLYNVGTHLSALGGDQVALNQLSAKYKSELQSGSGWIETIKNVFTGSDMFGIDRGEEKFGTSVDQITEAFENFNATIKATDNDKINQLIDSFDGFEVDGNLIKVSGSVDDVGESIVKLQTQLKSLGYENDSLNSQLTKLANNAQKIANNSADAYDTIMYNAIQYNGVLLDYYTQLTDKYNEIQEAQSDGDTDKVKELEQEYTELIGIIMGDENVEPKYLDYFKNLYPELQSVISSWEFETQVLPNIEFEAGFYTDEDVKDYIKNNSIDELQSQFQKYVVSGTTGDTRTDSIFQSLAKEADENNTTVLELLKNMKTLDEYSDKYLSLRHLMGDNWKDEYIDLFSDEEISLSVQLEQQSYGNVEDRLEELEEGGNVNLNLRPEIDASKLQAAGWDIEDGDYATVLTNTYSNEEGTKYLNFTPIIVDPETGQYKGVLSPTSLQEYAEGVIAGTHTDYLNLQIGAEFDTEEAAAEAAEEIHNLHELKAEGEVEFKWEYTADELKEKWSDDLSPVEVDVTFSTDAVEGLDKLTDAFEGGLDDVYDEVLGDEADSTFASASNLQSVTDDFGGVTFNFTDDEIADANAMSNAIEAFNDAMTNNDNILKAAEGDTTAYQDAIDQLATAYIDQSGILDDLTEDNYEYYISVLKAKGVTNAEEVVLSRVGETAQHTSDAISSLSLVVAQYKDQFEDAKNNNDWSNVDETATTKLGEATQDLLDSNGLLQDKMEEDDWVKFAEDNYEKVEAAINGEIDAIKELRRQIALKNYEEKYSDLSEVDKNVENIQNTLTSLSEEEYEGLINGSLTLNDIEITSDIEAIKSKFNTATEEGRKDFETYLETAIPDIDVGWITKNGSTWEMTIDYKGSSVGAGIDDITNPDDDDSDSDSDDDDDTDISYSEETFDWIETAIDRLESQIDRLDQEVENVYDNWSKRNGALVEEIDAITQEIEMQSDAADKYFEEAEEVYIPDEYKTKVQNGEMDIETINESNITDSIIDYFNDLLSQGIGDAEDIASYEAGELQNSDYVDMLSTAIDDYTDLYEKAMDASDEVVSL